MVEVSQQNGTLNPEDVMAEIKSNTCLITVMLANNETGVIQVNPLDRNLASLEQWLDGINKTEISFPNSLSKR